MDRICEIKHSENKEYYELWINGALVGTYDTQNEAAIECDNLIEEWDK